MKALILALLPLSIITTAFAAGPDSGSTIKILQEIKFPPSSTIAYYVNGKYVSDGSTNVNSEDGCTFNLNGDNVSGAVIPAGTVFTVADVNDQSTDCSDDDPSYSCTVGAYWQVDLTSKNLSFIGCYGNYYKTKGLADEMTRNLKGVVELVTHVITN